MTFHANKAKGYIMSDNSNYTKYDKAKFKVCEDYEIDKNFEMKLKSKQKFICSPYLSIPKQEPLLFEKYPYKDVIIKQNYEQYFGCPSALTK